MRFFLSSKHISNSVAVLDSNSVTAGMPVLEMGHCDDILSSLRAETADCTITSVVVDKPSAKVIADVPMLKLRLLTEKHLP